MSYSASLNAGIATIVWNGINSTTNLRIEGAANLGDELLAFVADPSTAPVDRSPHYQVYPTPESLLITTVHGEIELPWRWITPVANALNA